jgi:hypothetical protein
MKFPGGFNIEQMMKQAQSMQAEDAERDGRAAR